MSLLLYYIYALELQYDFDLQSQIKNRSAFEKEMLHHESRKSITFFVFDLNNLKKINDLYGHGEGDKLIVAAAKILNTQFASIGDVFRIGGDEFCAMSIALTDTQAKKVLQELSSTIESYNLSVSNKLELAQGYAHYDHQSDVSIYTALSKADDAMYAHKAILKSSL